MVIRIVAVRLCWMLAALLAAGSAYPSDDIQVLIDKAEQTKSASFEFRVDAGQDSALLI
ncbi:hypothetical protein [Pseudoxanthomonas mexicana]